MLNRGVEKRGFHEAAGNQLPVQVSGIQATIESTEIRRDTPPARQIRRPLHNIFYLTVVVTLILGIYSYPALRSAAATKSLRLPAVSAPDLGLYLSISKLKRTQSGEILNPYYHIPVPYPVSYLKFRTGPWLFGLLNHIFREHIWFALFAWNLLWWLLLCLVATWLLITFLPQPIFEFVLAGVTLLTVFSFEGLWRATAASIHGSTELVQAGLPYIRPFSSQMAVPFLLLYLGLQIRALRGRSLQPWGLMVCMQFIAFTTFPYATMMMAGTSAIAALWVLAHRIRSAWPVVAGFLFLCAATDLAFALHSSAGFRLSFPDQTSAIKFQPSLIAPAIGKLWVAIGILVIATVLSSKLKPEIKWTLAGLGLTNMALALGDAFVSERLFFLNNHIAYFYESTILVLFLFLASAYLPSSSRALRGIRVVALSVVVFSLSFGALMAEENYGANLDDNLEQADLARWVGSGDVSSSDLIITRFAGSHYDNCEWIPLLSTAEVLYCRNAQLTLTPEQNRDVQRFREVLYLYFDGKDSHWLQTTTEFEMYGVYGDLSSYSTPSERAERIGFLRRDMRPFFERLENRDPSIQAFFRDFRRVWIIQSRRYPPFDNSRLAEFLDVKRQTVAGSLVVASATPR